MPPHHRSADAGDTDTSTVTLDKSHWWTGTPVTQAIYYQARKNCLFDEVLGAERYINSGTVVSTRTGKVNLYSVRHCQDYLDDALPAASIDAVVNWAAHYATLAPNQVYS